MITVAIFQIKIVLQWITSKIDIFKISVCISRFLNLGFSPICFEFLCQIALRNKIRSKIRLSIFKKSFKLIIKARFICMNKFQEKYFLYEICWTRILSILKIYLNAMLTIKLIFRLKYNRRVSSAYSWKKWKQNKNNLAFRARFPRRKEFFLKTFDSIL